MHPATPRRGNCLVATLFGLAFIGLVLLVGGLIGALTTAPNAASQNIKKLVDSMQNRSFEAPGSIELELEPGGILIMLSPDGTVGDKRLGHPPAGTTFRSVLRDETGAEVRMEDPRVKSDPNAPFVILATAQIATAGTYTLDVRSEGDGSVPAAILVSGASTATLTAMGESGLEFLQLIGGICAAAVGLALLLFCGIPGLIVAARQRKLRRPDPLADL